MAAALASAYQKCSKNNRPATFVSFQQSFERLDSLMTKLRKDLVDKMREMNKFPQDLLQKENVTHYRHEYGNLLQEVAKEHMNLKNKYTILQDTQRFCNGDDVIRWVSHYRSRKLVFDTEVNKIIMRYCDELGGACGSHSDLCTTRRTGLFRTKTKCVARV